MTSANDVGGAPAQGTRAPFVARALATWFGCGLSPKAPGTVGSVGSLVLWAPVVLFETPWWGRALLALLVFVAGTWAAQRIVEERGREDPQLVVVDEVAGMGVTLLLAQPSWPSLLAGLLLFRVFDIAKPWPVRLADRKVKGGFGVMLDDVLAGGYALACLLLAERYLLPPLVQLLSGGP